MEKNKDKEPIPPRRYRDAVYPFKTMDVGDSFDVFIIDKASIRSVTSRVSSACANFAKRNSVKFTIRKMADKFIRVWRIQ